MYSISQSPDEINIYYHPLKKFTGILEGFNTIFSLSAMLSGV